MDYSRVYEYYKVPAAEDSSALNRHFPTHLLLFVLLAVLFAFGPGFQPIPPLFLPTLVLLVSFTRSAPSAWSLWLCAVPALFVGKLFAFTLSLFAGNREIESPFSLPWEARWAAVGFTFWQVIAIGLALSLDRLVSRRLRAFRPFLEEFFVLPVIWCALWTLMPALSPLGDLGNYGYALPMLDIEPLTVGASWWFGRYAGNAFIFGLVASCLVYLIRVWVYRQLASYQPILEGGAGEQQIASGPARAAVEPIGPWHPFWLSIYLLSALFVFGALYRQFTPYHSFFQRPIIKYAPRTLQVSCLTGANLHSTASHLRFTGSESQLVFWSENSTAVYEGNQTLQLLDDAIKLSEKHFVYLGLSYLELREDDNSDKPPRNVFVMIEPPSATRPFASVAFRYQKSYPIESIEGRQEQLQDYPSEIPYVDTPFGRIGALIGFDYDFSLVQQASKQGIDLMLQPAISYGPLGSLQTEINKLTSVESGFTLLRCDGGGVSGAFDQYHRTHTQKMTRPNNDSLVMSVPLFGRSRTAFALWGNLLGWVCVVIALLWLVLVTLLHFKGYNRFSYQFRTFLESLDAHFGNHPQ